MIKRKQNKTNVLNFLLSPEIKKGIKQADILKHISNRENKIIIWMMITDSKK